MVGWWEMVVESLVEGDGPLSFGFFISFGHDMGGSDDSGRR